MSGPTGSATVTATVTTSATEASAVPASASAVPPVPAPPLPPRVTDAFAADRTVVLLIVTPGGIDDARTAAGALPAVRSARRQALFVVPAMKIAHYAAITQGVDVSRVPALVVIHPRRSDEEVATGTVSYGYQSPQSIVQAVVNARYDGRTLTYHP